MPNTAGQHPSATLTVLRNHELLTIIFRQYLPWSPSSLKQAALREGRIQLRDCALVCKSFKEPALYCLWEYINSLIPLVSVLPNVRIVDNAYYFHGRVPPDSPFCQYAAKVRVLDLKNAPMRSTPSEDPEAIPTISPHLFFYLMNELEGRHMLPALKKIMVSIHEVPAAMDYFAILPLLCSDVVQSLGIYGSGFSNPMFATNCLPTLAPKLGSLKDLVIKCNRKDAGPHLLDAISQLQALENLRIDAPLTVISPRALLKILKALGKLKSIQLDLHFPNHKVDDNSFQLGATDISLPMTLSEVVVTSRLLDSICPCIPRFLLDRTTKILLDIPRRRNFGDYDCLARSLSKVATLSSVRVQSPSSYPKENVESILPFFTHLSLQEFKLGLPLYSGEPPLPALIEQAFAERPSDPKRKTLKRLYLIHDGLGATLPDGQEDGITLICLHHVARNAKGLEQMSAVLRSSFLQSAPSGRTLEDWLSVLRNEPKSTSSLQTLTIYDGKDLNTPTEFGDASNLAQILDLLFPQLIWIKPYRDDQTLAFWTQRWAYIENLRKGYKAARTASH